MLVELGILDLQRLRRQRDLLLALVAGDFDGAALRAVTEGSIDLAGVIEVLEVVIDAVKPIRGRPPFRAGLRRKGRGSGAGVGDL